MQVYSKKRFQNKMSLDSYFVFVKFKIRNYYD
jgi:hypothetical protein